MGVKSTTLKEPNDKEEMELIGLIENLKTHEMKRKDREKAQWKKKILTFKSTATISDDKEDDQEDNENFSLLVKNVRIQQR